MILPRVRGSQQMPPRLFPSCSLQMTSISVDGAGTHISHVSVCSYYPRHGSLDCLALGANGSYRTLANKELSYQAQQRPLPWLYILVYPPPSFSCTIFLEGPYLHYSASCLSVQLLTILHLGADSDSPLWPLTSLVIYSTTGSH